MITNLNNFKILENVFQSWTYNEKIFENIKYDDENTQSEYLIKSLISKYSKLYNCKDNSKDFIMSLFQFLKFNNTEIHINYSVYQLIYKEIKTYPLSAEDRSGSMIISTKTFNNIEFKKFEDVYEYTQNDFRIEHVGDNFLFSNFKIEKYLALSQKIAFDFVVKLSYGSKILVVLPTGSGKSLIGLGLSKKYKKKLTIIVMPTIALLIDQYEKYKNFFDESEIAVYYGGMELEEKNEIKERIIQKQLSVLYISPEAVMNKKLKKIIYNASEDRYLGNIVFDEAHLISEWGKFFRTEFQLLGIFINKMYKETGKINILFLSATITKSDVEIFDNLILPDIETIKIRGDSLRPEIKYYICNSETEKIDADKLIKYIPKPLIIYIRKPMEAEQLKEKIKEMGLQSVYSFTGNTSRNDRENILEKWNKNEIDIIVATSAFGLGVDKDNVRSIMHYYLPYTAKEFFQQAGRGGRDGRTSISYTYTNLKDELNRNNSKTLTKKRMMDRWLSMYEKEGLRVAPDTLDLDASVTPADLADEYTGNLNIQWNEQVLLFLQKHKKIDIRSISRTADKYILRIKILDFDITSTRDCVNNIFEKIHELEFKNINYERKHYREYFSKYKGCCISDMLNKIFPYTEYSCNGCNYCEEKSNNYNDFISNLGELINKDIECGENIALFGSYDDIAIVYGNKIKFDEIVKVVVYFANKKDITVHSNKNISAQLAKLGVNTKNKIINFTYDDNFEYKYNINSINLFFVENNIHQILQNIDYKMKNVFIFKGKEPGLKKEFLRDEYTNEYGIKFFMDGDICELNETGN